MAAESSKARSVKSGVIGTAVTRRMRKAKKPTSAAATAAIAITRVAPIVFTNSTRPCTEESPHTRDPAIFAVRMVSNPVNAVNDCVGRTRDCWDEGDAKDTKKGGVCPPGSVSGLL